MECGKDVSELEYAFYHCHDWGECIIFNPGIVMKHKLKNPKERLITGQNFTAFPAGGLFCSENLKTDFPSLSGARYVEVQCILCCDCVDGPVLRSHSNWVRTCIDE